MKKAIYLLCVSILGITILYTGGEHTKKVESLEAQITEYKQEIQKLESQVNVKDAKIFELASISDVRGDKIEELAQIVSDKNDKIVELRKQLKLKQEEEERQRLATMSVVFDPNDVTKPSNITAERLAKALSGDGKNLQSLASKFVEIEQTHGINAIYLASKTAWESGWATSPMAVNQNNIGGVKNPGGNSYRTFASKEACLDYIADFLSISYLDKNGKYYNGTSVSAIAQMYNFGDEDWIKGITSIGYGIMAKANNTKSDTTK